MPPARFQETLSSGSWFPKTWLQQLTAAYGITCSAFPWAWKEQAEGVLFTVLRSLWKLWQRMGGACGHICPCGQSSKLGPRGVQFRRGRQPCGRLGVETHLKSLWSPASRSRGRAWGHSLLPTGQPEPRVLLQLLHIARPHLQGGGPCGALKSTSTFGTGPE